MYTILVLQEKNCLGSSYSAALVIKLSFENSDKIDGVLAFSPASDAPMKGCDPNEYFEKIKTPMFVLRPKREMEYESVKTQFELAKNTNIKYILQKMAFTVLLC